MENNFKQTKTARKVMQRQLAYALNLITEIGDITEKELNQLELFRLRQLQNELILFNALDFVADVADRFDESPHTVQSTYE